MLLTAYPSITRDEFKQACQAFESRCQDGRRLDGTDWLSVTWTGEEVRIKQRRKEQWSDEDKDGKIVIDEEEDGKIVIHADDNDDNDDNDDEQVINPAAGRFLVQRNSANHLHHDPHRQQQHPADAYYEIDFSIAYSPTYSVPVLWFWSPRLSTPVHVHAILAEHLDQAVRSIGVMGAISQAYHPVTDMPAFFIHPCNTHSAMRAVHDGERLSQEDYLLIWLGLTGSSIGLHVPSHLLTHSVG